MLLGVDYATKSARFAGQERLGGGLMARVKCVQRQDAQDFSEK